MSRKVTFSLNTGADGGATVLQIMAEQAVNAAADRIVERANRISGSMRSHPQTFEVTEHGIGVKNRKGGARYYVKIAGVNPNKVEAQYYLDYQALRLALDAGRVSRLV